MKIGFNYLDLVFNLFNIWCDLVETLPARVLRKQLILKINIKGAVHVRCNETNDYCVFFILRNYLLFCKLGKESCFF